MKIESDRICMVCSGADRAAQDDIDATNPPPPTNPEDRALQQIGFLVGWLEHHDPDKKTRRSILARIAFFQAVVDEYVPTRYAPTKPPKGRMLRGGTG